MMDINKYILEGAIQNDICVPWRTKISNAKTIDELLEMYVKGVDFCIKYNFPSNDDLLRLGGDDLARFGIYINTVNNLVDRDFIVLLGSTTAKLIYTGYSVSQLFIKHTCVAKVSVIDNSYLVIDCFDKSEVAIYVDVNANALVNVYGNAKVTTSGSGTIKIVNKLKQTY